MRKVAIFMSDFHLGQKNRMEEFHVDNEFAELLGRLSLYHQDDEVDLVLLGDVLDLWTTVTSAEEERADTIADVDLYLPVTSRTQLRKAEVKEADKCIAIVRNHRGFFEALGRFIVDNPQKRQVIYTPGNHDHSLVSPRLQRIIIGAMITEDVKRTWKIRHPQLRHIRLDDRVKFQLYYESDYLQVYAEHGNQLTYEGMFRYEDEKHQSTFERFGSECPGYVQYKTVSVRGLRCAPKLNGILINAFNPTNWIRMASWLFFHGYVRALVYLQRYRIQYAQSDDERVRWARHRLPAEWKTALFLVRARLFNATKDEFGDIIPRLFEQDPDPRTMPLVGHKLDASTVTTLIMGHSHGARDVDVPGFKSLKYYNTGSWILTEDRGRECVDQTWVTVSRELPVAILQLSEGAGGSFITVSDKFGRTVTLKVRCPDLLEGLEVYDQVLIETDEAGVVSNIVTDDPHSRKTIDREMIRRRIEVGVVSASPATTDGTPLDPILRKMDLRVGDLMLFRWKFGSTLWRLARTHPFRELLGALPGIMTAAINRWGTSSYWNHIAMVFGSPSEQEEGHHYNDPLIIESVPNTGVGIHSPRHYMEYPNEWNFAVLRLRGALLNKWEARRMLRRITAGYMGAVYDMESVVSGVIHHVALTMDAKGRSALSGIVSGAALTSLVATIALLVWGGATLYHNGAAVLEQSSDWIVAHMNVSELASPAEFSWSFPTMGRYALAVGSGILALVLSCYVLYYLARLAVTAWFASTAAVGAIGGFLIVPIMADIAGNWTRKSTAQRLGFVVLWCCTLLPVMVLGLVGDSRYQLSEQLDAGLVEYVIMLLMLSSLCAVLFAGSLARYATPVIEGIGLGVDRVHAWIDETRGMLGWRRRERGKCGDETIHTQFICSGLIQEALVETANSLQSSARHVIVNPDWNPTLPRAEQACIVRNTLPRHFAQSGAFAWTHLFIDNVLTENPSASHRAQAHTPLLADRGPLCRSGLHSIKLGFVAACLTIVGTFDGDLLAKMMKPVWGERFTGEQVGTVALILAVVCGMSAIRWARKAQRALALGPNRRGRALAIYGLVSGALSAVIGVSQLAFFSTLHIGVGIIVVTLFVGLGSAFLLLF